MSRYTDEICLREFERFRRDTAIWLCEWVSNDVTRIEQLDDSRRDLIRSTLGNGFFVRVEDEIRQQRRREADDRRAALTTVRPKSIPTAAILADGMPTEELT
jgi:hypothetical protein